MKIRLGRGLRRPASRMQAGCVEVLMAGFLDLMQERVQLPPRLFWIPASSICATGVAALVTGLAPGR